MQSLDEKIQITMGYFEEIVKNSNELNSIFIGWTGGKDSTVVLWLWKKFLKKKELDYIINAITIDTGFIFDELKDFIKDFQKNVAMNFYVIKPDVNLKLYPKDDIIQCCYDLKIKPLNKAIEKFNIKFLLTGVRWDESEKRKNMKWLEKKENPFYIQINPILHWTEADIWTYHIKENIPHCSLYNLGYRSLDCIPCTHAAKESERSGRNPEKEEKLDVLHSLGYF